MNKQVHIFGGGTFNYVRNHLALAAPAFGETARKLGSLSYVHFPTMDVHLHLTKMAHPQRDDAPITNEDVKEELTKVVENPLTKVIFFNVAMCDFNGHVGGVKGDKYSTRLTSGLKHLMHLSTAEKVVSTIRKKRKDIFLVSFKTTCDAGNQTMYLKGLELLKNSSSNLVLVNDVSRRHNMIITPEEAVYHETKDREDVLRNLVEMTALRSQLTFTQSTVVAGEPVSWNSELVPESLRTVVNYCVKKNAYKPFKNATVGHFACKLDDNTFLTSIRKSNFNKLDETGLVKVVTDGPDAVLAYGAKPSVGGQSQRTVFRDHPGFDCIVHFHCPLKWNFNSLDIPIKSQREVECGSHQCGENTSKGLKQFGNLKAVYLDQHGPNIIFNRNINPQEVIDFIEKYFDLERKTGGYQL